MSQLDIEPQVTLGNAENENIAIGYHTMYLMDEGSGANVDENIAIGSFAMQGKDLGSDQRI